MNNEHKQSDWLIGSINGTDNNNFHSLLFSRHQGLSTPLIGRLKDSDKDKVPDRFDCKPFDSRKHGIISRIKSVFKKSEPQKSTSTSSSSSSSLKRLLDTGGSKVIAPTKENVTTLLQTGGTQVHGGSSGTSYDPNRFSGGGSSSGSSSGGTSARLPQTTKETPQPVQETLKPQLSPQQKAIQQFQQQQTKQQQNYNLPSQAAIAVTSKEGLTPRERQLVESREMYNPYQPRKTDIGRRMEKKGQDVLNKITRRDKEKEQDSVIFERVLGTDEGLKPKPEYKEGEKFSVRYFHVWAGRKLAKKIPGKYKPSGIVTGETTTITPSSTGTGSTGIITPLSMEEISRQRKGQEKGIKIIQAAVAEIPTYTFFSPFMATGAAQQSKYIYDYKKGRFLTTEEAERYTDQLLRNFDEAYKSGGTEQVKQEISKILTQTKDTSNADNLLNALKDKGYIKDYILNTQTGEVAINTMSQGQITATIPAMKNIEIAETASNLLYGQRQIESEWYGKGLYERTEAVTAAKNLNAGKMNSLIVSMPQERLNTRQRTTLTTRSDTDTRQKKIVSFISPQVSKQMSITKQVPLLNQPQKEQEKFKMPSPTITTFTFPGESSINKPPRPEGGGGIPPPFGFQWRKKKERAIKYIPEVRRYGVFEPVASPTSNLGEALARGIGNVQRTLGASLRIRREGGQGGFVILREGNQFRRSKRDTEVLVQRRGFRLSSFGEREEIKEAKRKKRFRL